MKNALKIVHLAETYYCSQTDADDLVIVRDVLTQDAETAAFLNGNDVNAAKAAVHANWDSRVAAAEAEALLDKRRLAAALRASGNKLLGNPDSPQLWVFVLEIIHQIQNDSDQSN